MSATAGVPLAILNTALVTSVGLDAPTTCVALRAKLTNPVRTRFVGYDGEWLMGHEVPLIEPLRGLPRLVAMASMAIEEALRGIAPTDWPQLPILLCVAEKHRPGRTEGIDEQLFLDLQAALDARFDARSSVVALGRVGMAVALSNARTLLQQPGTQRVLVVAVDSLLSWPTLSHYDSQHRLLTPSNSNGFMPGEGAGALLVGHPQRGSGLLCTGIGFGMEAAHIDSELPLRGDGLAQAIKAALADAGRTFKDMDFRITDLSGEHYYFKEATLALQRTSHERKEEFDLWHPAECTGETGALAGVTIVAMADAACRKGYAKGGGIVAHMANDDGRRAALALNCVGAV